MYKYTGFPLSKLVNIISIYTIYETVYDPLFYFEGEYHNFWEIVCVLQGEVGVTEDNEVYKLKSGQMILHEPMEFHRLWSEGESFARIITLSFGADRMPDVKNKVFELSAEYVDMLKELVSDSKEIFEFSGRDIVSVLPEKEYEKQIFANKLELFLSFVLGSDNSHVSQSNTGSAKKYALIVDVMKENIDKNLTIADIAAMCNMSASNLKKIFSQYSRMGVMKYFNTLKIKRAVALLSTNSRICEIAAELGFEEQNYFSAVFKRETGYSPLNYKKKFLNI